MREIPVGRRTDQSKELMDKIAAAESDVLKQGIKAELFSGNKKLRDALRFTEKTNSTTPTQDIITYKSLSPQFGNVSIILHKEKGKKVGHYVVAIHRRDHIEYYNPTGKLIDESPIKDIFSGDVRSSPHKHQDGSIVCGRHVISRACYSHLSNDEYNELIENAKEKYRLSADAVVTGITNQTLEREPHFSRTTDRMKAFQNGGIVYGRRYK